MTNKGNNKLNSLTLVAIILTIAVSSAMASETISFDNGITATIYDADESNMSGIALVNNTQQMYPFDRANVINALRTMHGFKTSVTVDVFILNATPVIVSSSFASKDAIYLAPGTGNVPASTVAYITTHEMGHVMTWAFMDESAARWNDYLTIRSLDATNTASDAAHADRAREIVAEDIRFLFGGDLATSTGSIENHYLDLPDTVDGLEEMLVGFFANRVSGVAMMASATAFPNPCNPLTTIEMSLPADKMAQSDAVLRIFDVRGSLVSTINGGEVSGNTVSIKWSGTSDSGRSVASGQYMYVMQMGSTMAKGSVTLVR
jgi:hypothetical protein